MGVADFSSCSRKCHLASNWLQLGRANRSCVGVGVCADWLYLANLYCAHSRYGGSWSGGCGSRNGVCLVGQWRCRESAIRLVNCQSMVISDGIVVIGVVCVCTAMLGDVGDSTTGNGFVEIGGLMTFYLFALAYLASFITYQVAVALSWPKQSSSFWLSCGVFGSHLGDFFRRLSLNSNNVLRIMPHDKAGQTCQKY